jgi:hypothetical protein
MTFRSMCLVVYVQPEVLLGHCRVILAIATSANRSGPVVDLDPQTWDYKKPVAGLLLSVFIRPLRSVCAPPISRPTVSLWNQTFRLRWLGSDGFETRADWPSCA